MSTKLSPAQEAFLALLPQEHHTAYLATLANTQTVFNREDAIAEIMATDWTTVPEDNLKKIRALAKRPEVSWEVKDGKIFLQGKYEVTGKHGYKSGEGLVFKKGCGRKGGAILIEKIEDETIKELAMALPLVEKND